MQKKWIGPVPKRCDICHAALTDIFFDARSTVVGRWGNFCQSCFESHTTGRLGIGHGQRYENTANGWVKTA